MNLAAGKEDDLTLERSTGLSPSVSAESDPSANALRLTAPGTSRQRLILVTQMGLWLLFVFLLARLFWTVFAPLSAPATAPDIPAVAISNNTADALRVSGARNPFALANVEFVEIQEPVPDEIAVTTLALTLHGVRIDGEHATAIIDVNTGNNNRRGQGVFAIGDEITDGVELLELHPGEAIISRGGVREALLIDSDARPSSTQRPRNSSVNRNAATQVEGRARNRRNGREITLQNIIQVRRRTQPDGRLALFLYPGKNREAFAETGLIAQDMLLSVNGTPPPQDIRQLYQLMEKFTGAGSVSLVIERGGIPKTITVNLAQPRLDLPTFDGDGDADDIEIEDLGDEVEL